MLAFGAPTVRREQARGIYEQELLPKYGEPVSRHNPSINRQAFPNTPAQWFWSATESDRPLPRVWVVWFSRGGVDDYHRGSAIFARPVRGQPNPDFVLPR